MGGGDWELLKDKQRSEGTGVSANASLPVMAKDGRSSVIEQLEQAAEEARSEDEAAAVMAALSDTNGLAESGIAPDVLARLLPDDEIVALPRLDHVNGGADTA